MPIDTTQLEDFRRILEELRREIQADLSASDSAKGSLEPDKAIGRLTRMEAIQAQSMGAEGRRRQEKRLQMIDRALERIEAGTYGRCIQCGSMIPVKRLEFMPEAALCVECARARL